MSLDENRESLPKVVGDWENDPEWSQDDLSWVLAWIEVVLERNAKPTDTVTKPIVNDSVRVGETNT